MAHQTMKSAYEQLAERLNRFPQGAPPSETLYAILKLLFSEREAGLVALLPIKPFTAKRAAQIWKMDQASAQKLLQELASRAILLDTVDPEGQTTYALPPPMAGFFEFAMMRLRGDIDQKALASQQLKSRCLERLLAWGRQHYVVKQNESPQSKV